MTVAGLLLPPVCCPAASIARSQKTLFRHAAKLCFCARARVNIFIHANAQLRMQANVRIQVHTGRYVRVVENAYFHVGTTV